MSATQGNYREYETIFIMRPDSSDQHTDSVHGRIKDVISRLEGQVVKLDSWGKRKLAYSIRDRTAQKNLHKGIYFYLRYMGGSDLVPELERNLRMLEPVIRYMTIKLDADADPAKYAEGFGDEKAEAAAQA